MASDPYAAPRARVADAPVAAGDDGNFNPEGNAVPAGNGWQWISGGWELFSLQKGMWIGVVVVLGLIFIVLSLIPLLNLALTVIGPVFLGGLMLGCAALRRGEELTLGHLFAGFQQSFGKLVVLGLIALGVFFVIGMVLVLAMGLGVGMLLGLSDPDPSQIAGMTFRILLAGLVGFALAVPVYMALWFAPALVTLNGLEPVAALKTSFFACLKNIVPFLIYGVIGFALSIVASIPLMLGWLVLGPVFCGSVYAGYRDIFYGD